MSANSEPQATHYWYKLGGKSEQAIRRAIEASQNGETPPPAEKKDLATALGLYYAVIQAGQHADGSPFHYAAFPETFAHPLSRYDEFYMYCPVGSNKDGEAVHFIPDGGTQLNAQEVYRLESLMFPPQGASVPIVQRDPVWPKP